MSRNFPLRTAVTGRRSVARRYTEPRPVAMLLRGRSAGYLSSLIAPPGCDRDSIPRVDASRVSQRDERSRLCVVVGLLRACEGEQSEHPCREAQERCDKDAQVEESCAAEVFCFHGWGYPETNHKPVTCRSCETPNVFVRFRATTECILFQRASFSRTSILSGSDTCSRASE